MVPALVEPADAMHVRYRCLCTRYLETDKAVSKRVVLRIGEACNEYLTTGRDYKIASTPHPQLRPMRKARRAAAG